MKRLSAWVDGGARGNPGPAGYGVLFRDETGAIVLRAWGFLGETTNNVAEYRGLIAALREATVLGATHLDVSTDSELIQRQVTGVYKVRQPHLVPLMNEVRQLIRTLEGFRIVHVRREENKIADALANRAMDRRDSGRDESPVATTPS